MANDELTIPVEVRKTVGISLLQVVIIMGISSIYTLGPLLSAQSIAEIFHNISTYVFGGVSIVMIGAYLFARIPCALKIDQSGVDLTIRKTRYYVVWSDIAHVTPIGKTVRVELKGRPDDEAITIPAGLGLKPDKLTALLRDGVERWGAAPARTRFGGGETSTPPGAGKAETRAALLRAMWLMGGTCSAVALGLIAWQVSDYTKEMELRTHGVRTQGSVVRIYTGDCGKHSCSINVEYSYSTQSGKVLRGIGYLASDDEPNDPDYVYAKSHATIPIVVDQRKPSLSDVNFDDKIFRGDPLQFRLIIAAIGLPIMLGIPGFAIFMLYRAYRKAGQTS